MNRDGQLNAADILLLQRKLLQAWLGSPPVATNTAPRKGREKGTDLFSSALGSVIDGC